MLPLRRLLLPLVAALSTALSASAQVSVSYAGGTYTQDFNTLPSTGAASLSEPTSNPGQIYALSNLDASADSLAGWSFIRHSPVSGTSRFSANDGSSNTGSAYSYGAAGSTERALGAVGSSSNASRFGVVLVNNTGSTITSFTLSYTGEQWRRGTATTDQLTFSYAVGASTISTDASNQASTGVPAGFTGQSSLNFASPQSGSGATDGNTVKQAISGTVSGISWAPNQTLVLQWTDRDDAANDDGLAIDDLSFSTSADPVVVVPAVTSTTPAANAVNVAANASIGITFNTPTAVSGDWYYIEGSVSGAHDATVSGGPTTYSLTPSTIFAEGETVTVFIFGAGLTDAATHTAVVNSNFTVSFTTQSFAPIPIHTVQGSGATSSYVGQAVTVEGIVTADFQATPGLSGFYIQTPDASADNDDTTSEGIFVFNTSFPVNVGESVRITGTVAEFPASGASQQTELTNLTALTLLSVGNTLPVAKSVTLPFPTATFAERYEGMLVTLPQSLTVTDTFMLGQYGEVFLSNGRLSTPTNVVSPGAPAIALAADNARNMILLDDAISTTYPDPTPFLADSAGRGLTRRAGSTATGVTGILDEKFGSYTLEPTAPIVFVDANPRSDPPAVGGTLKVAIGNVLNFFNGDGNGGGFPTSRGADTFAEYQRQRAKIVAGITKLAPDIMGLTEIENDGYGALSAIQDLVNGLNASAPSGTTYAFVDASAVDIVTDEIHCGFIYRVQTVGLVGAPAMLNHPAFNGYARNPLAQTFKQLANGEKFTVSINHFKSKSSASTGAAATGGITPNPNNDQGDGQGQSNYIRKLQAKALTDWLATDPTNSGDPDFLIIGDLNAYAKEDPIAALENAGYINLTEASEGPGGYSYAFDAAFGHLDHALANDHLAGQVVEAVTWHANSDEPVYYDYNVENKNSAQQAINVGTPYRYSDHDPVVVGLNLQPDPAADVTANLQITRGGFLRDRKTGRYVQVITIKNTGTTPLAAPVSLVFAGLSANATLNVPTGYTTTATPLNSPYRNIGVGADNILSVGETATLTVEFNNATNQGITYTLKVLAGPGAR